MPVSVLVRQGCISFLFGLALGTLFLDFLLGSTVVCNYLEITSSLLCAGGVVFRRRLLLLLGLVILGFWYVPFRSASFSHPLPLVHEVIGVIHFVEPKLSNQRLIVRLIEPSVLKGQDIFVYSDRFPNRMVGEIVQLKCTIEKPEPFQDFAFDRYAQRRGIIGTCRYPRLAILGTEAGFRYILDSIRRFYAGSYARQLPAAEDSLLQAMVLNRTGEFPEHLLLAFSASGLSHSISVSGLHMSLLIMIAELVLGVIGFSRSVRLTVLTVGLSAYLILLGFPSPAVRSSIMGVLMIWAAYSGRQAQGTHILLLTATAMLVQNPLLLGYDIGFQLSCLALLGMGLTNAQWKHLFSWMPERLALREVCAATFSAQMYTWPLTLYYFGTFSFIAPVANAFVLPLLPLLLSLAFIAPLLSMVPAMYSIAMIFLFGITKLMNTAVIFFGSVPYAATKDLQITFVQALAGLALMGFVTWVWQRSSSEDSYD